MAGSWGALRLLFVALLMRSCVSKVVKRRVRSVSSWVLVDRFAFMALTDEQLAADNQVAELDDGEGSFVFTVNQKMQDRISVSLFIDMEGTWEDVNNAKATEMNCAERQQQASVTYNLWKVRQCSGEELNPCVEKDQDWASGDPANRDKWVTVEKTFQFRAKMEAWMYVVVSNCDPSCSEEESEDGITPLGSRCQSFVDIDYEFEFKNSFPFGDPDATHFSAEEVGMYSLSIAFLTLQTLNLIFMLNVRNKLVHRRKFHWTVLILAVVIFLHWLALVLSMAHYDDYSSTGIGYPGVLEASRIIDTFATGLFIALLVLLAKGWTIVRRKLSPEGRIKIVVFTAVYICMDILANVLHREEYQVDSVKTKYQTGPGQMMFAIRICAACWFTYAATTTRRNFERKHSFYKKFTSFYLTWLVALPFLIGVSKNVVTTRRFKFVATVELTLHYLGQTVLLLLYNPSTQFNRSFPFHSTTSSMLGMNGSRKDNAKDTGMFSSKRANRRDAAANGAEQGGEGSNLLANNTSGGDGGNYVQSSFQDRATAIGVQTISGGLGIHKSKRGQIVVKNQFDAIHFLRLKMASDAIKNQLGDLIERSILLDSVLDGITVENAAQYGNLGHQYLNSITKQMNQDEGVGGFGRAPLGGGFGGNGGNVPKKKQPSGFGNLDSLKMNENGKQVLEMVQRVGLGGGGKSSLHTALDDEMAITKELSKAKDDKKGGTSTGGKYNDDILDGDSDQTENRSGSNELDRVSHPPTVSPPQGSEKTRSVNSDDEFDHDVAETGRKIDEGEERKPQSKKGPPSHPPPKKERGSASSSRDGSRQNSRQGSRRGSRESSVASSPKEFGRRAPMNSFVGENGFAMPNMKDELEQKFRSLEMEERLDAEGGEGGGKVKKKKKKKKTGEEKKRKGSVERQQQEEEKRLRDEGK